MDILDLLSGQVGNNNLIEELSKSTGAEQDKVKECVKLGIPTLMEAMGRNAKSPEGASALEKALDNHKDANLNDISGFLSSVNKEDGNKILKHILGSNNNRVNDNLSRQTGLKSNQVSELLAQLAPLLMGMLGKQKSTNNVDAQGLSGMLMSILGSGSNKGLMSKVTGMLDSDGDGSIIDDIGKMAGDFFKK